MTAIEAAELLNVDRETVKNYIRKGVLVAPRRKNDRGGYQILRSSVEAFLSEGYDVAAQSQAIEQMRKDIADEKEALKTAKETLLAQKEAMRIKGVMYENILEFRQTVLALLDCMGEEVLTDRETDILMYALSGNNFESIGDKFCLTRERVRQIYHKALRRLKNSKSYVKCMSANEEYQKIIKEQESKIDALQHIIKESNMDVPIDAVLVPESLIGLDNYHMSVRAYNLLRMLDIKNLWELAAYSRHQFARVRNLGRKTLNELDILLERFNLEWGKIDSLKNVRNAYGDKLYEVSYATIKAYRPTW